MNETTERKPIPGWAKGLIFMLLVVAAMLLLAHKVTNMKTVVERHTVTGIVTFTKTTQGWGTRLCTFHIQVDDEETLRCGGGDGLNEA